MIFLQSLNNDKDVYEQPDLLYVCLYAEALAKHNIIRKG